MMYYLQKHGENLETAPASYGCLHPKWQKQRKGKQLSTQEWSALWQVEQCSMEPINPKTSHHMTSLDKWTVSALFVSSQMSRLAACMTTSHIHTLPDVVHAVTGLVSPASPRRSV